MRTKLSSSSPMVKAFARATFPAYRGRKFRLVTCERVSLSGTFWDGGSRSSYAAFTLADSPRSASLPQYAPPQFGGPRETPVVELKPGYAIAEHSIFCGKDTGLTFYIHPSDATPLLPEVE